METIGKKAVTTPVSATDGAVGIPASPIKKSWYIAVVPNRSERICSRELSRMGIENYVATQWESRRMANGRRRRAERLVLPARIFVRTTERERLQRVVRLPFINRFMSDAARKPAPDAPAPAAVVPDREMELFRHMLGQEEFPVFLEESRARYSAGDKVVVTRGHLAGMTGIVKEAKDGRSRLYVSLDMLGSASVEIDRALLEPVA